MASAVLPASLVELLNGRDLQRKVGHTLLLVACEAAGWPRMAMLSVGEVLATSETQVRLALYSGSGTTHAVTDSGRALLIAVLEGVPYKIRLEAAAVGRDGPEKPANADFVCEVRKVDEDRVGYATVEHGIEFSLFDEAASLERWQRTIGRLESIPQ